MPEMDGLEATRTIRAAHPRERQPWIIAVTAGAIRGDRETCLAAGMNDFLIKPVERQTLADAIARRQPPEGAQAQRQMAEGEAALDPATLQHLALTLGDQDNTLLTSLIATFIESTATLQASARAALAHSDGPTLRRAMHTLKSNASTFGAKPLAALCRDLEHRAADGNLEGASAMLEHVATEIVRVRGALEALGR
jgi:CheY-like chemotaxis protein